ncbi:HAD family hydrolase [Sphingobacterium paludis]|nr:HAD hydrolase-like protein [Sphingobacterium paludis]
MDMFKKYKVLLWDFDGVIMDSMPIRDLGFLEVLKEYPQEQVDALIAFHQRNGGLSRYVKFRYFFEHIRGESITDDEVLRLAGKFSEVMLSLLINKDLLIQDSVQFIQDNHQNYAMHVVSGSDGQELNYICEQLGLDKFFRSIHGSPTPKKDLVRQVLLDNGYNPDEVVLIGDSVNDHEAAQHNAIDFTGYNNVHLHGLGSYVTSFDSLV